MKYLFILLCNILFSPFICCNDTILSKSKVPSNVLPDSLTPNVTQVASEGGSISPDKLIRAFPKSNHNIPSMYNEIGKSKIVARKGAFNYTDDFTKSPEILSPSPSINQSTSVQPNSLAEKSGTSKEQPKSTTNSISLQKDNVTLLSKSSESISKPVQLPKKPLILNADVLEKSPLEVKSSPETLIHNQIQSPNSDVKSYLSKANNHPGMVMPIVITILLVPMFAVLGYMALRRGQEAWKNRHYKRMDFLLDGMYND